ncbi:cytochrome P450 [Mycena pura]|uniref:Cytochrome P450 n=1 Tax=Mycena pura TaxID=153505 RepID=A0AAD6YLY3_9AGAR|nr:cytochrome P450 [Mycena pura]
MSVSFKLSASLSGFSLQVLLLLSLTLAVGLAGLVVRHHRRLPLPPVFNQGLGQYPWTAYAKFSKTAGPLITIPALGRPIVVINTTKAASDLLERRSSFADRPRWPMAELLGRQDNVGFTYYGERLKKMRKELHAALSAGVLVGIWGALLDRESLHLCQALLNAKAPDAFYDSVENNLQQLIVQFTYGRSADLDYIRLAKLVMHQTGEALQPGRWSVNFLPALKYVPAWVPGAGFKRWAAEAKMSFYDMTRKPFYRCKEEVTPLPLVLHYISNDALAAGTETVSGTVLSFIAIMLRHPEVQERAYREIVSVVGTTRLPDLSDRRALPYVNAIIQEIHRFNPAVPLVTHGNSVEEEYEGMRIPKKTWVMGNVWAMLHDEEVYPEPDKFVPERFAPPDGAAAQPDPNGIVFGFGRRRCPGLHFANAYLYLVVARTLALFKLVPPDGDYQALPPIEFMLGLISSVFALFMLRAV